MDQDQESKRPRRTNRERAGGKVAKVKAVEPTKRKACGLGCEINERIKQAIEGEDSVKLSGTSATKLVFLW